MTRIGWVEGIGYCASLLVTAVADLSDHGGHGFNQSGTRYSDEE